MGADRESNATQAPPRGALHWLRWRMDPGYRAWRDAERRMGWLRNEIAQLKKEKRLVELDAAAAREETADTLRRVALAEDAAEMDAIPYLAGLNASLARLKKVPARRLKAPGEQLTPGVALQFAPEAGVEAEILDGDDFGLRLIDRGASDWFGLSLRLPLVQLQTARWFGLRISGRASHAVSGAALIRCAHGESHADIPLPVEYAFDATPGDNLGVVEVRGRTELEGADHADLLLFFRQSSFELHLSAADIFCAA